MESNKQAEQDQESVQQQQIDPFILNDEQDQDQDQSAHSQPKPSASTSNPSSDPNLKSNNSSNSNNRVAQDDNQGFNPNPIDYDSHPNQPQPQPTPQPNYSLSQHNELPPLPVPNIDISDIQIIDAIKTSDGPGLSSYVAYIIQSGSHRSSHRYSTFSSLRSALVSLYPTLIIPPIPDKHTLTDYAAKGVGVGLSKSKDDAELVKRRRRMLQSFLRRCAKHETLGKDVCFLRFLEGRMSWYEISTSPPLIFLPKNLLRTSLSNPASSSRSMAYSSLPLPSGSEQFNVPSPSSSSATAGLSLSSSTVAQSSSNGTGIVLKNPNQRFLDSEAFTNRFANHIKGALEKLNKKLVKKWFESSSDFGELGSILNGFSLYLSNQNGLSNAIEQFGKVSDAQYLNSNIMLNDWEESFTEPLHEYSQFSGVIQRLLKFRHLKHVQLELAQDTLAFKRSQLEEFMRVENQKKRLDRALQNGGNGLVSSNPSGPSGSVYGSNSLIRNDDSSQQQRNSVNENWHRKSLYGSAAEENEDDDSNAWNQSGNPKVSSSQNQPSSLTDGEEWSKVNYSNDSSPKPLISDPAPPSQSQPASSIPTARDLNSSIHSSTSNATIHQPSHKTTSSYSGFLNALTSTFQSVLDTDPETTRRNNISKLKEQILLLEEAVELTTKDLNFATNQIQADLDRFQRQKVQDLRDMLIGLSKAHRDFCKANLEAWKEARESIEKIQPSTNSNSNDPANEMPNSRLSYQGR